jgi:hypothetical protein
MNMNQHTHPGKQHIPLATAADVAKLFSGTVTKEPRAVIIPIPVNAEETEVRAHIEFIASAILSSLGVPKEMLERIGEPTSMLKQLDKITHRQIADLADDVNTHSRVAEFQLHGYIIRTRSDDTFIIEQADAQASSAKQHVFARKAKVLTDKEQAATATSIKVKGAPSIAKTKRSVNNRMHGTSKTEISFYNNKGNRLQTFKLGLIAFSHIPFKTPREYNQAEPTEVDG